MRANFLTNMQNQIKVKTGSNKKKVQPFETREHDLTGCASLDFHGKEDFNAIASQLAHYNPNRFEPVALRIYVQNNQPLATIFAVDTFKQEQSNYPHNKIPVKKFRLTLSWDDLFKYIKRFDFTVSNGTFDIKDILVINK